MRGGPYGTVAADTMRVAVTALLLVRGCPTEQVEAAIDWLGTRRIPENVAEVIQDVDLAIAVVRGDS